MIKPILLCITGTEKGEALALEEAATQTWFLVISTTASMLQQGGISRLVDQQFDAAYNESVIAGRVLSFALTVEH